MKQHLYSFYFSQSKRGLRQNRSFYLFLLLYLVLIFFLIALISHQLDTGGSRLHHLSRLQKLPRYSLRDRGDEDGSYQKYLHSDEDFYRLKGFVHSLRRYPGLIYVSLSTQSLSLLDEKVDDIFLFQYEMGHGQKFRLVKDKDRFVESRRVKGLQLSTNAQEVFQLKMDSGHFFDPQDDVLHGKSPQSVILGHEYQKHFKLGQVIRVDYLFEPMEMKIIGFFQQDSQVLRNGQFIPLDRYICLPAFAQLDFEKSPFLSRVALAEQSNGQIFLKDPQVQVKDLIDELSAKYATFSFDVFDDKGKETGSLIRISGVMLAKIRYLIGILLGFMGISLTFLIYARLQKDRYTYSVHLLCGGDLGDFLRPLMLEFALICTLAVFLAQILCFITLGFGVYLLVLPLSGLGIFLLFTAVAVKFLAKNLDQRFIQRRD